MYFNRFNRNTRFLNRMTNFLNRNTKFFNQNSRFFKNMWQKAFTYTHFGRSILIIHSLKTVLGKSLCYLHNLFEELQSHCLKSVRTLCFSGAYFSRIWNEYGDSQSIICIHCEYGKIWARETPNTDIFHAVSSLNKCGSSFSYSRNILGKSGDELINESVYTAITRVTFRT